ncbi:MAG: hypothetical protein JNL67_11680 [Planctomycetaceae bacterium]|nr:hypothetical protein [Planctomycetaceae bacterium]
MQAEKTISSIKSTSQFASDDLEIISELSLEVWEIEFANQKSLPPNAYGRPFGSQRQQHIVRKKTTSTHKLHRQDIEGAGLTLVMVPDDASLGMATVQRLQDWLERRESEDSFARPQLLALQGAQIVWHPQCVVIMVPANRVQTVCQAVLDGYFYEAELRSIEAALEGNWENTLGDAPLGFEFNATAVSRRSELAERFQEVLKLRTRLARLTSNIVVPHVYPPTLASQIGERLRERLRMEERLELVEGKLEVQEHVYEMCSHRTSEYMVARTGHHLEWVIILLLGFQTILWIVDLLSTATP